MAENIDPQLVSLLAGGGIGSDARMPVAPVQRDPKMEKLIQVMAMSGREPTPEMDAYLRAIAPEKMERSERLAGRDMPLVGYLPAELSGIPQMGRAASGVREAVQDPTIPNVTNAAVQTSLTALRPMMALKALGAGYGAAVADDIGAFDSMSAEAQSKKGAPSRALPGLMPEQQAEYDALEKKIGSGDFGSSADRRMVIERHRELRTISDKFSAGRNSGAQAEYDRQVTAAEVARDKELARDRRFSDTEVGKLWDKTGGLAPVLAGTVTGAMSRSATGGGSLMHNYGLPAGLGTLAGVGAANVPLAYNSLFTEPDNPQKRAMEAYARELPPSHPRRAEFEQLARTLADANPVRTAASAEFYDPEKLKERAIMGGAEGLLGGMLGADGPRTLSRMGSSIAAVPGRLVDALLGRKAPPGPVSSAGATAAKEGEILAPNATLRSGSGPAQTDELARTLSQGQLPAPSTAPSSDLVRTLASSPRRQSATSATNRPTWASDPPEGVRVDKGYYWDASIGQQRHEKGGFGPAVKYSAPRGKKEGNSPKTGAADQSSVQVDDMRPLRYPEE